MTQYPRPEPPSNAAATRLEPLNIPLLRSNSKITMSYAYPNAPFHPARRNSTSGLSNILVQIQNALPPWAQQWIAELRAQSRAGRRRSPSELKAMGRSTIRRMVTIANALILFWVWILWWGERTVFQESLEGCSWGEWEKWVCIVLDSLDSLDYNYGWKLMVTLIVIAVACYSSPCRIRRRSAISRSPYVSRTAVAAVDFDGEVYGSIPAAVVFVDAEGFGTRYGAVSW